MISRTKAFANGKPALTIFYTTIDVSIMKN